MKGPQSSHVAALKVIKKGEPQPTRLKLSFLAEGMLV